MIETFIILLHMVIQFSQYHLLKWYFPHWIVWAPLSKIFWSYMWEFLASLFYSSDYMSVFMPAPHSFVYCSFIISFEIRKCETSSMVLLFQDGFDSLRFLQILYEFMDFSVSGKHIIGIFRGIQWSLDSIDHREWY